MRQNQFNEDRLAEFSVMRTVVNALRIPLMRQRNLISILNAIEVQLEGGGDNPDVNEYLLRALQAAVRHEVSDGRETAVLQAINSFAKGEFEQWQPDGESVPTAKTTDPIHDLDALVQAGYVELEEGEITAVCDAWLAGWELAKPLITPDMKIGSAFDTAYPNLSQSFPEWLSEMEMELYNAGLSDPIYHQHRVQFAREYLNKFSETPASGCVSFRRAEAEGLWHSGKRKESEAVYRALIEQFPTEGWAYIGWSDMYYWDRKKKPDYASAEEILLLALQQPILIDKKYVLDRLESIYTNWNKPEKQAALVNRYYNLQPNPPEPPKKKRSFRFFKKQTHHKKKNKRKKRH